MRKIALLVSLLFIFKFTLRADEGMWLLTLLNKSYDDMKKQGLKLKPEDIYNVNKASLKDAIVIFGGGCTGEIVSDQGLLLTNHHCGYGTIQSHSTVEHDYLKNGFWAMTKEQEIASPNLTVTFLQRIEDVSEQIIKNLNENMSAKERTDMVRKISKEIEDKYNSGLFQTARVVPMFSGNQYILFVYEVYRDVRLVGTPPQSIGKFGGDTDNWMWPRHTGDFSVFRVYMSKDGKPAEYSKDNVPLKPKYYLPVSIKGVNIGDFTMIMGFPGRTNRFMTSFEIDEVLNVTNPNRVKIRTIRQEIMMSDMKASDKVRIQYASKYAGSSNFWKKAQGEMKGLVALKVKDQKLAIEKDFSQWVNADAQRKTKYGEALTMIERAIKGRAELGVVMMYYREAIVNGIEVFGYAANFIDLSDLLGKNEPNDGLDRLLNGLKRFTPRFFKDYNAPTDQKIAKAMLKLFMQDVNEKYYPEIFNEVKTKYNGNYDKYIDDMFSTSFFVDKTKVEEFLNKPEKNVLDNDIVFIAVKSIMAKFETYTNEYNKFTPDYTKGMRLFTAGLLEKNPKKAFYPDANSTMRFTYGTVKDYKPRDGVLYEYITTMKGIIEKEDANNPEFEVHPKLKELYMKKDFGRYAKNGDLVTCFLSNNDITGGNSGSPIMNAKGELIGLAFDGNWEALSSDIAFDPALQRTINVDIRYVLFVMDKFGGAKHLVDEMKIVE